MLYNNAHNSKESMMSVKRFKSLLYKSSKIQAEIIKEQKRPKPNWLKLCRMKKLRLSMKDKMLELSQQYASLNTLLDYKTVKVRSNAIKNYRYRRYQ